VICRSGPGRKPTKSVGSRETKLLGQWISLCLVTEFLLPTIGGVQMEMIRTILVLAIAFAARLAHAEGPEPITILDMPDLCVGGSPCSRVPRTKTCCRTSCQTRAPSAPMRDAVRASGKPSDTVKGRCIRSSANLSRVSRHPGRIQFQHRLDRRPRIGSFSVVARRSHSRRSSRDRACRTDSPLSCTASRCSRCRA